MRCKSGNCATPKEPKMAKRTLGQKIVEFLGQLKSDPAALASFIDQALLKGTPHADGMELAADVVDGYRSGHKHAVPTKDEIKTGPTLGARGNSAEDANDTYSSNAEQHGAQLAAERLSREISRNKVAKARAALEKAEDADFNGDRRTARAHRRKAARLLGEARTHADNAGRKGRKLRGIISDLMAKADITISQEQEEDEEEEDDDDDELKSRKASRQIDEDEEDDQRKWPDRDNEREMKSITVGALYGFLLNGKGLHPKHAGMIKSGAIDVAIVTTLNAALDSRRISPEGRAAALNTLTRAAVAASGGDYSKRQVRNDIANLPASVRELTIEVA
jgi:hypothetical protein